MSNGQGGAVGGHDGNAPPPPTVSQHYIPPFQEFVIGDNTTVAPRWDRYIKSLERLFKAAHISDEGEKRDLLLYYVGEDVNEIFDTLTDTGNDYLTAKTKLTERFAPKQNVEYHRCLFGDTVQAENEPMQDYYTQRAHG